MKAKAGSIVWVKFPYEGKTADKPHPAFVLDVLEGDRAVIAYGSSKKVDVSCPRPNEVVVSDPADLAQCGLQVPTRFDLAIRASMVVEDHQIIGELPQNKYKQLYRAAVFCHLIKA